uniref:KilA-N domain-containing protein n=1 Tax=Macrostomum lignano TaxID=282301 RepID=A0A1I8FK30_9PLAT
AKGATHSTAVPAAFTRFADISRGAARQLRGQAELNFSQRPANSGPPGYAKMDYARLKKIRLCPTFNEELSVDKPCTVVGSALPRARAGPDRRRNEEVRCWGQPRPTPIASAPSPPPFTAASSPRRRSLSVSPTRFSQRLAATKLRDGRLWRVHPLDESVGHAKYKFFRKAVDSLYMELNIWFEGQPRTVCNVTRDTSCHDVIMAVARTAGLPGRYKPWRLLMQEHEIEMNRLRIEELDKELRLLQLSCQSAGSLEQRLHQQEAELQQLSQANLADCLAQERQLHDRLQAERRL